MAYGWHAVTPDNLGMSGEYVDGTGDDSGYLVSGWGTGRWDGSIGCRGCGSGSMVLGSVVSLGDGYGRSNGTGNGAGRT